MQGINASSVALKKKKKGLVSNEPELTYSVRLVGQQTTGSTMSAPPHPGGLGLHPCVATLGVLCEGWG